jgi:hypothetical protein
MLLQVQQKKTLIPKLVPVDIDDTSFASSDVEKGLNSSNATSEMLKDKETVVTTKQLLSTTSKSIPPYKTAHIQKTSSQSTASVSTTSSMKTPPPSSTLNVIKVKQPGMDKKRKLVDDHEANNGKNTHKKNPSDEIDDIFRGLF